MSNRFAAIRFTAWLVAVSLALLAVRAKASDPPHDFASDCESCHIAHGAADGQLTTVKGNANLCMSCHTAGGPATGKAFANNHQALPWPGLPAGTNAAGTSHRWDSGPSGHVTFLGGAVTSSTGRLLPAGAFTGLYAKTYTLTITNSGNVGAARFDWTATAPGGGSGSGVLTSSNAPLDEGLSVSFSDGSNTSFQATDRWNISVRTDLAQTTNAAMLLRMTNGVATCSACHNQHLQAKTPFDPSAPAYSGTNVAGRHFMRIDNDRHQMCLDCHAARGVTNATAGSHPVEIPVTTNAYYRIPATLPREKVADSIGCLTCHKMHFGAANNGMVLRMTNTVALCADCHTLADTNSPAAHLVGTDANTLWPGGQYGSLMPARTDTTLRGSCLNCHPVHGWPDAASPTNDFPMLLADGEENLCFTCHDADGPAVKRVKDDFARKYHHPVANSDSLRRAGRSVECTDCHHVHDALAGAHVYTNTATATRNRVSNPIKGVAGVSFNYSSLTNFQVVTTNFYSALPETAGGATNEYLICFKCHTGYGFPNYSAGTASFTNGNTAVAGSGTAWTGSLVGMWIARAGDTVSYVITNVSGATSLGITPAYAGTTASGQNYRIVDLPAGLTPIYTNGTANFTTNSASVTGSGTAWLSGLIGWWIYPTNNPAVVYKIIAVASVTNLTILPAYAGATASAQGYAVAGETDVAQEFSPANRSGHPVITGLTNYPNSLNPKGLPASNLLAPWNTNVGQQTMMCSDCHNTDAASPAAQGPHGSAAQFMLRGSNANNWPNVTLNNFASSWCANCHQKGSAAPHTEDDHSSVECYRCHIVIPHGGKVSRLIGDRETMPARYAYRNILTNMYVRSFLKYPSSSYEKDACQASCTSEHNSGGSENW